MQIQHLALAFFCVELVMFVKGLRFTQTSVSSAKKVNLFAELTDVQLLSSAQTKRLKGIQGKTVCNNMTVRAHRRHQV